MASICSLKAIANRNIEERRNLAIKEREPCNLEIALFKMREKTRQIQEDRAKRTIIFLKEVPKIQESHKVTEARCKARTLENKPCPFRATCGNYCKRHQI
jgi:hypothetical protein